jgi:hypothetical protein
LDKVPQSALQGRADPANEKVFEVPKENGKPTANFSTGLEEGLKTDLEMEKVIYLQSKTKFDEKNNLPTLVFNPSIVYLHPVRFQNSPSC